jgi:hypothetical protein
MPPLSSALSAGSLASFPIIQLILGVSLFLWLVTGWLMYRIGRKLDYPKPWMAWVPFLFVLMMVDMAGRDRDWFWIITAATLIPCLGIVALVMLFILIMDISESCGYPRWWAVLWMIILTTWPIMFITGAGEAPAKIPSEYIMPSGFVTE